MNNELLFFTDDGEHKCDLILELLTWIMTLCKNCGCSEHSWRSFLKLSIIFIWCFFLWINSNCSHFHNEIVNSFLGQCVWHEWLTAQMHFCLLVAVPDACLLFDLVLGNTSLTMHWALDTHESFTLLLGTHAAMFYPVMFVVQWMQPLISLGEALLCVSIQDFGLAITPHPFFTLTPDFETHQLINLANAWLSIAAEWW